MNIEKTYVKFATMLQNEIADLLKISPEADVYEFPPKMCGNGHLSARNVQFKYPQGSSIEFVYAITIVPTANTVGVADDHLLYDADDNGLGFRHLNICHVFRVFRGEFDAKKLFDFFTKTMLDEFFTDDTHAFLRKWTISRRALARAARTNDTATAETQPRHPMPSEPVQADIVPPPRIHTCPALPDVCCAPICKICRLKSLDKDVDSCSRCARGACTKHCQCTKQKQK